MKILFVLETVDMNVTNTYRHLRQLISKIAKSSQFEISIITIENQTYSQPIENVKIIRLKRSGIPILDPIKLLISLNSLNNMNNFDIIYVHIISKLIIPITLIKKFIKAKIVYWHAGIGKGLIPNWKKHLGPYLFKKCIYIPLIKNVDYFITGSSLLAYEYQQKYKLSVEKFRIIHNFVDVNEFISKQTDKIQSKEIRFLYVGRLSSTKGTDILINEFQKFLLEYPNRHTEGINFSLDIYGGGDKSIAYYKNNLSKIKSEKSSNITFKGPIKNKKLPKIFTNYDVFILPSRNEGFPRALIEAMSSGLCCIAPNKGAIPEIITKKSGILFDHSIENDLFNKLIFIATNRDKINYYGKNARERIIEKFSLEIISNNYENLFLEIEKDI